MANAKISALTAVTTPLAGTETLPIVQSSTTKKATVSEILNSTQPTQSAYAVTYLNASKIQETGSTLQFVSGELRVNTNAAAIKIGGFDGYLYGSGSGTSKVQFSNGNADLAINGSNSLLLQSAGNTRLNIASTGDVTLSTGNLVQGTAAKGVNFTANTPAAGMTSQLLNWYEEGAYTPTVAATSGTLTSYTVAAAYTRIGRTVTVVANVTVTNAGTGAGALTITLPWTANGSYAFNGSGRENALTGYMLQAYISAGGTVVNSVRYDNTSAIATNAQIRVTITYFV